jgi:hypothetical protein
MWKAEHFSSLDDVLAFLNRRGLRPPSCKLVVARDEGGGQLFHLLYVEEERPLVGVAAAEAEVEGFNGQELDEAIDEAEAILAEARRED